MIDALDTILKRIKVQSQSALARYQPKQLVRTPRREMINDIFAGMLAGYEVAPNVHPEELARQIREVPGTVRAVIYEGVYCRLAMLDLAEGNNGERLKAMVAAAPNTLAQLCCGIGAALAHTQAQTEFQPTFQRSFFGWMTTQARGCHDGYFRWPLSIEQQIRPVGLSGWAERAYDEGLGCAIWYTSAASPRLIESMTEKFPPHRRHALWDGIGTQVGMWGMDDEKDIKTLLRYAGPYAEDFQHGVVEGIACCLYNDVRPDYTDANCTVVLKANAREVTSLLQAAIAQIGSEFTDAKQFVDFKRQIVCSLELHH